MAWECATNRAPKVVVAFQGRDQNQSVATQRKEREVGFRWWMVPNVIVRLIDRNAMLCILRESHSSLDDTPDLRVAGWLFAASGESKMTPSSQKSQRELFFVDPK